MQLLETYIRRIVESVERKYKLNTIITKTSQIIVNQLKQFFTGSDNVLTFELDKSSVSELFELDDLLIIIDIKRIKSEEDDETIVSASYDDWENKIRLYMKVSNKMKHIDPETILLIKSNLRHELEHTLQNVKQFLDTSEEERKKKYFEREFEIRAYATELYTVLRLAEKRSVLTKELFLKFVTKYTDQIQTLKQSDKDKFRKMLVDYMIERYPLISQVMTSH